MHRVMATMAGNSATAPRFFRLRHPADKLDMHDLLRQIPHIRLFDTMASQLAELVKTRNPNKKMSPDDVAAGMDAVLDGLPMSDYGVWVYYPWSDRLVHTLDEAEFAEMRTNRNKYKITGIEQEQLYSKKIGVIGLSVGQSVSLTMAMERSFGELRIADYDDLEITNLNRLRSGIHNMGLQKTVLVAREIAEIDPFLKVTCFHEGITDENIESFLLDGGKLDVLIDECDSVDIKIKCRVAAKRHHIPVLMEASDRGTIDIERFDLEPDRPILHGYVEHLDLSKLKELQTMEEKLPYILPIVGIETMSVRLKASAVEIGKTISTWPQLASAVTLGGGMTADVCRRVLLDQLHVSGRFFIDLEDLIHDDHPEEAPMVLPEAVPLTDDRMLKLATPYYPLVAANKVIDADTASRLVMAARKAPSAGNMQPWKWWFADGRLFLFHDRERSASFGDFRDMTSNLSLGTAIEHIFLKAAALKLDTHAAYFPAGDEGDLVAVFGFSKNEDKEEDLLAEYFDYRRTNRNDGNGRPIEAEVLTELQQAARAVPGARLVVVDDKTRITKLAEIAGKSDKLRIFIEEGHFDLFHRELKFSNDAPEDVKEGLDIRTLDLKPKDQVGFRVIRDLEAIRLVSQWNGGEALEEMSRNQVASSAAVGILTMPEFSAMSMLDAGRAIERVWLAATAHGISFQPLLASVIHFARVKYGNGEGIPEKISREFSQLNHTFNEVVGLDADTEVPLFFFRLCYAEPPKLTSQRLDADDIFRYK